MVVLEGKTRPEVQRRWGAPFFPIPELLPSDPIKYLRLTRGRTDVCALPPSSPPYWKLGLAHFPGCSGRGASSLPHAPPPTPPVDGRLFCHLARRVQQATPGVHGWGWGVAGGAPPPGHVTPAFAPSSAAPGPQAGVPAARQLGRLTLAGAERGKAAAAAAVNFVWLRK